MESVYIDYYEKLDDWYESLNGEKELSIGEAKELVQRIKECSSAKVKERLQEKLLTGTIGEVYRFIKSNGLLTLCDTGYFDFDDLVSTLTMTWVEDLYTKISNVGRYSTLFSREYFKKVAERLGIEDLSGYLRIKTKSYFGAMATYFRDRTKIGGEQVCVSNVFFDAFANDCEQDEYLKSIDFIEKCYQMYREYAHVYSDNSAVLGLFGMAYASIIVSQGRYDVISDKDFIDQSIKRMDVKDIIFGSRRLTDEHRRAIYFKYGFDGGGEKQICEVAQCLGVNYMKSRDLTISALMNLRADSNVLKYRYCKYR